jgi:ERCC4-type nuclease
MLLMDDRENDLLIHKVLTEMGDGNVNPKGQARVQRLNVGDYVLGDWGIEAKEINDLYRSIDLCASFDKPFLVVYNHELKPWFHGRRPTAREISEERQRMRAVIKSFLVTLHQRFPNLRYMHLNTMDDFVEWLATNHRQNIIAGAKHSLPAAAPKPIYAEDPRVKALMVRKVRQEQAEALLKHYGSIPVLLRKGTRQKDMMQVAGINRKQAKAILSLRDEFSTA